MRTLAEIVADINSLELDNPHGVVDTLQDLRITVKALIELTREIAAKLPEDPR